MGEAYKLMGNAEKAQESYQIAASAQAQHWRQFSDELFFKALSMRELGKNKDADEVIASLKNGVNEQLNSSVVIDEYSKFGEDGSRAERLANLHYLNGLAFWYEGSKAKAKDEFGKSIKMNQNMIWPKVFINM